MKRKFHECPPGVEPMTFPLETPNQLKGPEHLSLKVPNIEFDFDISVDSVQWQTVTSKLNLRPYNSVQMCIRCKISMYCVPKITLSQKFNVKLIFDVLLFQ